MERSIFDESENRVRDLSEFRMDEEGVGTIELVLILIVLIGLVVVFKTSITKLLNTIFKKINTNVKKVY